MKRRAKSPYAVIEGSPSIDQVPDLYFWITAKGRDLVDSSRDEEWPFDDEGELLPGWCPPAE